MFRMQKYGRQVVGELVDMLMGRLLGRQVDRHGKFYIASFEPAKGQLLLLKLVLRKKVLFRRF